MSNANDRQGGARNNIMNIEDNAPSNSWSQPHPDSNVQEFEQDPYNNPNT